MPTVTDPATSAHPQIVDALRDWAKFSIHSEQDREARIEYVRREMERLEAAGISPLYAAVTFPLSDQQTDAFRALHDLGRLFTLRLAEGAQPPHTDSQGRLLPEDKRGKVLAAKVGTVRFASAGIRASSAAREGDIARHREISSRPVTVPLEEAIVIMRQWGYRVRPKRAQRPNQPPRRDEWLVVHVREDGTPFAPPVREPRDERAQGRR